MGLLWMRQWSSQNHKRQVIHSNSARPSLLRCDTWRSLTGVDDDYALSTGERLWTFWWNVVPSSWTVGPEDEGKLTSWQGETSQMTWIFTSTAVRISQPPTVVPKRRQETTNRHCVKSQNRATKHTWTDLNFNVRNKFCFMNVLVQQPKAEILNLLLWNLLTPHKNVFNCIK
jgi:hypothetical protein